MSNEVQTTGDTWFITGASAGFGRALAEEVLARGGRVVAAARNESALTALASTAPDRVRVVRLDVTDSAAVGRAIEAAGDIDVLVNNAGYSLVGAVEETSEPVLRRAMETMFFGAVAATRAALPRMRERARGTIVQITSMGGLTTAPGFGAYCAAKHALEGFSECLAKEVAPLGLRVLIVEPGAFRTSLFGAAFERMPEHPAYAATVGAIRAYATTMHGTQPGDPVAAARAIHDAVTAGCPTLRLPLGADALEGLRAKLAEVDADLTANAQTALSTTRPTP